MLHRDKVPWFRHIEAPTVRFVLQALIVSGENGLADARESEEPDFLRCKGRTGDMRIFDRMMTDRNKRGWAVGALLASALALGGCSISIADLPLVGTPAGAPERPKEAGAYLPVHDLPPDREEVAMPPAERAKIQDELIAARDRQASAAAAKAGRETRTPLMRAGRRSTAAL